MKSIRFEKHLVDMHPEAFQELQTAISGSLGWHNEKGVGLSFRDPLQENHTVKGPLCEHAAPYNVLQAHVRDSHPEIDPRLVMTRFNKVHRCKDDENLNRYQDELNQLVKEYAWLKRVQAEPWDGSKGNGCLSEHVG